MRCIKLLAVNLSPTNNIFQGMCGISACIFYPVGGGIGSLKPSLFSVRVTNFLAVLHMTGVVMPSDFLACLNISFLFCHSKGNPCQCRLHNMPLFWLLLANCTAPFKSWWPSAPHWANTLQIRSWLLLASVFVGKVTLQSPSGQPGCNVCRRHFKCKPLLP